MNFKVCLLLIIAFISGLAAKAANTPATFVGGTNQSLITCPGTASTIDSFLITNDPDVGQNLTWAIFKGPSHGTLHGFSGSGTSNGGNVAPTGFSYNSNVGYTGIDSFVISVNDGFATSYTKVSIFIQSGPTLSPISGNTSLCVGNTSQLTDTAKGGTWSSSNTAVARVSTGGLVTAVAAGTATISYSATSGSGCTSIASATVTVYAIPTVANITGTNTVCVGSTTQFSDNTAGGVWSSSNTNNATVDQTGLVTGITGSNNGNTATITYTVTNGTACSTAVTRNVTVYSIPTVASIAGNVDVCTGNTITLTDATNGGTWSSLNTAIAVVSANGGVVTGVAVGTDTIRYTVTSFRGCSNYKDTIVNVSTAPVVTAIQGTTKNICVGKTTTLTDATAGGKWSSSNVAQAKVDSLTGVVTAVSAGGPTIRYTVTNTGGCSTTVNYTITVNNNPTVAAIVGTNTTCINSTISLTDNTPNGVWSSTNIKVAKVDTIGNVTGLFAGTDTIAYTVTSAAGCTTSSILPISIVTGIPVKPIYGVSVLCSGNSTVLQDSTAGGTWTSSDNGVAFPVGSTIYAGSGGTATITYTVSGGAGCSGFATFNFTVIQVPTVPAITGNSQVCVGSSIQLTNSVTGGFWTSSNTSLATVDQTGLVKGITSGGVVISYTVTGNGGCTQTSTANVNVNALPTVKHIVGSNSTCVGATSIYTDSTAGGVWKSSNTAVATISVNGIFQTKTAGNTLVTYTVTNGNQCSVVDTISVDVNQFLVVSPIKGADSVCQTFTTILTDSTTGGTWVSRNTTIATLVTTNNVTTVTGVNAGTVYIIDSLSNGGCIGKDSILITVNARPTAPSAIGGLPNGGFGLCAGATNQFTDNTQGGVWSSSNSSVASIVSNSGLANGISGGTTTISYTISNSHGCTRSSTYNLTVNSFQPLTTAIQGSNTVCAGTNSTYTDATTGGTWSSSNTAVATINSTTGVLTALTAGTITLNYSVAGGGGPNPCPRSITKNITINPAPPVTSIIGNTSLCANGYMLLTDNTGGGVWSSYHTTIANVDANGIVSGVAAGKDTIAYTVTDGVTGCTNTAYSLISVNALPVISPITGTTSICIGKTSTLADATTSGVWGTTNSTITSVSIGGLVTGLSVGTDSIYYKVTNANKCSDSVVATFTVNGLPVIAAITGAAPMCVGTNNTLSSTTLGGTWKSTNAAVATVSASGFVQAIAAGTTTIRYIVTNASGCADSVSTTITVNPLPVIGKITGTTSICLGKTTILSDTTAGGNLFNANPSVATYTTINSASIQVTGVSVGTDKFTYVVTNVYGCVDSVSATVLVNSLPSIAQVKGATTACVGKTAQLTDATAGGTWVSANKTIATVNTAGLVSGIKSGTDTIRYSVTNLAGCTDSVYTVVTINPLPVIGAIIGSSAVCVNATLQLSDTSLNGTWTSANNFSTVNASGIVTALSAGTGVVRYTVTNVYGCVDSVSSSFTVNPLPTIAAITGTTSVCFGKTTTLSETTTGGIWKSITPSVATIDVNGLVTAVKTGTSIIRYTVTNGNGCTDSVSTTVTVNALPVIAAIGGNTTVCVRNSTQLTETTTGGTWKSVSSNIALVNPLGLVAGLSPGTSTIRYTVTNSNGCVDSTATTVTVNALPVINSITGTTTICVGKTTQLTEITQGGTWKSATPTVASIDVNGLVTGVKAGTDSIRYIVTNGNGCIDSVAATVKVNALPVLSAIAGSTSFCMNNTNQLTDTASGGVWSSSNTNIATNTAGLYTAISTGTFTATYTVTNGNGCTNSVSVLDTVNALPVLTAITGNSVVCAKNSITLSSTPTGGTWYSLSPFTATVGASTGIVTGGSFAGGTTIRYVVSNVYGCKDSVSKVITVNALPVLSPITGTTAICAGKTSQLTETTSGGTWNSITPSVATIDANGLVTAIKAGTSTIRYIVTNGNGCTDSVSATVTVNALPVVAAIGGTTSICAGKTTQLTETTTGGTWKSVTVSAATVNSTGLVTGVTAGSSVIRYTVTNGSGCTDSVSTTVTVNALPVIAAIGGTTTICAGKTTQLSETTTGGTWKSVSSSVATIDVNGLVTAVKAGTSVIRYTVTNGSGCTDSVSATVTVNALPVLSAITGATSFCANKTNQLSDTAIGGIWSSSNNSVATNNASGLFTAVASGTYTATYTLTNGNGCTSSVSVVDTVNAVPSVSVITGNSAVCAGSSITLSATTNGTGVWSSVSPFTATVGASTGVVTGGNFAGGTTIKYVVSNSFGCQDSVSKVITVNPTPVVGAIGGASSTCVGSTLNLTNNTAGGKWTLTNNTIATIDSVLGTVNALAAGTDTVYYTVTNGSGCSTTVGASFVINLVPAITSIGSNTPVNAGDTLYLTSVSSVPGVVYSWTGPNGFTASTQNPYVANTVAANAGKYFVSANNNGCISNLDSVSVVINVSYMVSGTILSPKGNPINIATVNVTGSSTKSTLTDASGNFSFMLGSGANTSYVFAPYKNNDSLKANGITTLDVALIQSHVLQKNLLTSPYKILAADVNGDGKVSTLDIVFIKRLILGLDTTFTAGTTTKVSRLWGFVDSAYTFADATSPFPSKATDTISGLNAAVTGKSFVGFKLGDVNWDWKPSLAKTAKYNAPVEMFYNPTSVDENGLVRIPVRVKNFKSMIGMQFTLSYNKDVFEFISVNKNHLNIDFANHSNSGSLSFIWNDPNNDIQSLNDNDVLFELVLSKKAYFETEDFTIDSRITVTEAVDGNFEQHEVVKTTGVIMNKPATSTPVISEYVHVGPNPNNGKFNIEIASLQNKSVNIRIVDIAGRLVATKKVDLIQGKNVIGMDISKHSNANSGNYFLSIEDGNSTNSYKILVNP